MKKIYKLCLPILLIIAIHIYGKGSTLKSTIIVQGNCEHCKQRIEKAARIKGVSYSFWNMNTDILTVKYDSLLTNTAAIEQSIALAGHDTKHFKVNDSIYNTLPGCCRYR